MGVGPRGVGGDLPYVLTALVSKQEVPLRTQRSHGRRGTRPPDCPVPRCTYADSDAALAREGRERLRHALTPASGDHRRLPLMAAGDLPDQT